jgi:hypothetical protein
VEFKKEADEAVKEVGYSYGLKDDVIYFPTECAPRAIGFLKSQWPGVNISMGKENGILSRSDSGDPDGLILTGVPISATPFEEDNRENDFRHRTVVATVENAINLITRIMAFDITTQMKWYLVRICVFPRLAFLGQTVHPSIVAPIFHRFDSFWLKTAEDSVGLSFSPDQVAQFHLPCSLGGMGFIRTSLACWPAYISTSVKVRNIILALIPELSQLLPIYNQLVGKDDVIQNDLDGVQKLQTATQKELTYAIWYQEKNRLATGLTTEDQGIFILAQDKGSADFLTTSFYGTMLTADKSDLPVLREPTFQYLVRHRFVRNGRCLFQPQDFQDRAFPVIQCKNGYQKENKHGHKYCQETMDPGFLHASSGCSAVKYRAHSVIEALLRKILSKAGILSRKADPLPGTNKKADFISLAPGHMDAPLGVAVDISIRSPYVKGVFFPNTPQGRVFDVNRHIRAAETSKNTKYANKYRDHRFQPFVPFIMSTTGALGPKADEFLQELQLQLSPNTDVPQTMILRTVKLSLRTHLWNQLAQNIDRARFNLFKAFLPVDQRQQD